MVTNEEMLWKTLKIKYQEKVERGEIEDNPKYWENINEEMRVFKKNQYDWFYALNV